MIHEISRDIQVGDRYFHIHTEPSAAQKEACMTLHGHDSPDGPWPWWATNNDTAAAFAGGPYASPDEAMTACEVWVTTGKGNNL